MKGVFLVHCIYGLLTFGLTGFCCTTLLKSLFFKVLTVNLWILKVTHWHSPQFHAYFPTANSYPAIVADILSDAIGCIGFSWVKTFSFCFSQWPRIKYYDKHK